MTPDGSTTATAATTARETEPDPAPATEPDPAPATEPAPAPHPASIEFRRAIFAPIFDFSTGHGLEIGPLASPIADASTADVDYVDVVDRDDLVEHYGGDPAVDCDKIPELDYWLKGPDGFRTLSEAVAPGAPYDWVVASHVVEHIPDLVGWFTELGSILSDGGHIVLAVPDRRFTFDILRPGTTTGQLLAAHATADMVPSTRAAFDHFRNVVVVDVTKAWNGWSPSPDARTHTLEDAREMARRAAEGEYIDAHVWTFTPSSFVEQVDELGLLGLIDLTIADIVATRRDQLEFYVVLERLARAGDPEEREQRRRAGIARARAALPPEHVPTVAGEVPPELSTPEAVQEAVREATQATEARLREEIATRDAELHRLRVAHHDVLASQRWMVGGVIAAPVAALRRRLRR